MKQKLHGIDVDIEQEKTHKLDWYIWQCPKCNTKVQAMKQLADKLFKDVTDMLCHRCK